MGGTTLFYNFDQILKEGIGQINPELKVQMNGKPSYRSRSAWIGASIFANLDSSRIGMITKEVYDELGAFRAAIPLF